MILDAVFILWYDRNQHPLYMFGIRSVSHRETNWKKIELLPNKLLTKLANDKSENKVMLSIAGQEVNDQGFEKLGVVEMIADFLSGKHSLIFGTCYGKKLTSGKKMRLSGQ